MRRAFLAAVLLVSVSGCDAGSLEPEGIIHRPRVTPTSSDARVIGLVGSMTGALEWAGEEAFEGADAAVQALNRDRGEGGVAFELVTLDDGGDAELAADLVTRLASSPRTVGVVYAGPPEGLARAAGALEAAGIPGILCTGDLYSPRLLKGPLFQASPPLVWQAEALASYLVRDRGYRSIGALVPDSLDGTTAARSLRAVTPRVARLTVLRYSGPQRWTALLDRLERRGVEAIVVHGGPDALAGVAELMQKRGDLYESTAAARLASAPRSVRLRRRARGHWHPQLAGFDLAIQPRPPQSAPPPGTVVAETYGRGVHYLPLPSLQSFRSSFTGWWGSPPLGREQRAYDAVRAIGWAAVRDAVIVGGLERARDLRFAGLSIDLGSTDHLFIQPGSVGLWIIPSPSTSVRERSSLPPTMPWVPLARSFALGPRTRIAPLDWAHLFAGSPDPEGTPPRYRSQLFGVTTGQGDPIH